MRPLGRALSQTPARLLSSAASKSIYRPISEVLGFKPEKEVKDLVVHGFVRSVRSMKGASFVALDDGSSMTPLQAVLPPDQGKSLSIGAAVRLQGTWAPSLGNHQTHELHVEKSEVLGPSDAKTFPIQKKYHTPDYLRTIPHLRPRIPYNSALLRFRSEVITFLNQYFAKRQFIQTHPPLITSSDCEGAGEVFTVSPANQIAASSDGSKTSNLFFRSPKYLTVSTQLHLEALAQSVGNVWTLSPTFRAEKSDTSRHLSEFYMLEAEMCFASDLETVMDLVEDMLRSLAEQLGQSETVRELGVSPTMVSAATRTAQPASRLENTERRPAAENRRRWLGMMRKCWPRITYTEAINYLNGSGGKFTHKPTWGAALQSEHEKYLAETIGGYGPVFITHYPRNIKPFYMLPTSSTSGTPGDQHVSGTGFTGNTKKQPARETVDCFDLLIPEFCEIAGGSMREHRYPELLSSMQAQGLVPNAAKGSGVDGESPDDAPVLGTGGLEWYADLRRWGCPPHGGFGLGFDRLLCYLTGVPTLRDIVAFPRWYGRCDC